MIRSGRAYRRATLWLLLLICSATPFAFGFLCYPLVAPLQSTSATPVPVATFAPTVSAGVSSNAPGANANVSAHLSFPAGSTLAIGAAFNIPRGWRIAGDLGVTNGSVAGLIAGSMTVADEIFPGCGTTVEFDPNDVPPTSITLLEATTSTSDTVSGRDTDGNGVPDVIDDSDLNGLPNGVEKYPDFLNTVLPGQHKLRYFGHTKAAGLSDLYVNIIVDEIAKGGPYLVTPIVNDPTSPPESATNQFCAPQSLTLTLFGISADNPATLATEGGQVLLTNPMTAGSYTFSALLVSEFDKDNDGWSNGLDNCPAVSNPTQQDTDGDYIGDACDPTISSANFDIDGDGLENGYDNCIFVANSATAGPNNQLDSDYDDIGDACDDSPSFPDGPNYYLSCTDPVGIGQGDPGGATCVAATPVPTPTPKPPLGDTDGDTIPNESDPDDDNDGCSDVRELSSNQNQGGRRDPHNPWDFYDINGDRVVSLPIDILGVAGAFGSSSGPNYTTAKDRSAAPAPGADPNDPASMEPWDLGPPDGAISVPVDILGVASQFGHSCL